MQNNENHIVLLTFISNPGKCGSTIFNMNGHSMDGGISTLWVPHAAAMSSILLVKRGTEYARIAFYQFWKEKVVQHNNILVQECLYYVQSVLNIVVKPLIDYVFHRYDMLIFHDKHLTWQWLYKSVTYMDKYWYCYYEFWLSLQSITWKFKIPDHQAILWNPMRLQMKYMESHS